MRFLTADYLYPLDTPPLKQGVLQISEKGEVISVFQDRKLISKEKLEIFEGILCPGFVNAHCHLELSHLFQKIDQVKGLLNFIIDISTRNNFDKQEILTSIQLAEEQMIKNGIVGVGDICNTADTLLQKQQGNLEYYNFIEVFAVQDGKERQVIYDAKKIRSQFRGSGLKATISPHSPYSVSKKLMQEIVRNFDNADELLTIHIQESIQEIQLFEKKNGMLLNWLKQINATSAIWERNQSLDVLNELENKKILMVHNTFAREEDIQSNYYCTCPNANLYIENTLPDYSIFNADRLCVGTDSLASNNELSIFEELLIIKENSNFDLQTLLKIGCKNGAEALGFSKLGTFEKGKKPGINLISELNQIQVIV